MSTDSHSKIPFFTIHGRYVMADTIETLERIGSTTPAKLDEFKVTYTANESDELITADINFHVYNALRPHERRAQRERQRRELVSLNRSADAHE